jgi:ornithine decarboxylase
MFMMQASTSPFYPLFSSLDVNAQMHGDAAGRVMWNDAITLGIEARKAVRRKLGGFLDPFVPDVVVYKGKTVKWEDVPTDVLASDQTFWELAPGATWHGYRHLGKGVAMTDPTKLMLTTRGIDHQTGEYEETGIPATIVAAYLRENNIIPEKNDLNSILFLMTPAIGEGKTAMLLGALERFKDLYETDAPMSRVLPRVSARYEKRYAGYTIRQLCQELHGFYRSRNVKELQRLTFRYESFPEQAMTAREATEKMVGGEVDYIPMSGHNRIAATLPHLPTRDWHHRAG